MSQTLNFVPTFDGSNYGYWNYCIRFFLKSIKVWSVVESRWKAPGKLIAEWSTLEKQNLSGNDKAMNAICLAISQEEFSRISKWSMLKQHGKRKQKKWSFWVEEAFIPWPLKGVPFFYTRLHFFFVTNKHSTNRGAKGLTKQQRKEGGVDLCHYKWDKTEGGK
jgi:hypothetical protein